MGLETTTVISGLDATFPTTADAIQQGDDHIRLIKAVLKNCFPNVNAPLTASMVPNVPAGNLAATTVQAALNELDSEKVPLNGTGATGTWDISINGSAGSVSGTTPAAIPDGALGTGTPSSSMVLNGDRVWREGSSSPTGAVMYFLSSTAPTGWLKANGAAVSRTTYAALFALLGTTYGAGDGSTTFNLPDLRGEFLRAWSDGRSVDSGRVLGSAQGQDIQPHTHSTGGTEPWGAGLGGGVYIYTALVSAVGGSTGSAGTTETRPRNVAALACIKY